MLLLLLMPMQAAALKQHSSSRRLMLEAWLDGVLGSSAPPPDTQQHADAPQSPAAAGRGGRGGAARWGIARAQLLDAGLSAPAVDQLHRGLFVHSVGFADALRELLAAGGGRVQPRRRQLLEAVWRVFMVLAEHAMQAAFHSEVMGLVDAAGAAVRELCCTQGALAEFRRDNAALARELSSLAASEAEATALRRSLPDSDDQAGRK